MADYVIAIPSYNRVETLRDKTLAMLESYKIPKARIHIFVADKEQETLYKEGLPKSLYGQIIVGQKGLMEARNFITRYYPENKPIVSFDDDVSEIKILGGSASSTRKRGGVKPSLVRLPNLDAFLRQAFATCKKEGLNMWGIYPVYNAFFMKPGYSTDLKFLIGHMHGVFNKRARLLTTAYKDDYERTLLYATADGGVVRFNNVVAKTKMGAKGGLDTAVQHRLHENKKAAAMLMKKFPGLVRLNPKREGEILLARRVE